MEVFLERLAVELLVLAIQVAIMRFLDWLRARPANARGEGARNVPGLRLLAAA